MCFYYKFTKQAQLNWSDTLPKSSQQLIIHGHYITTEQFIEDVNSIPAQYHMKYLASQDKTLTALSLLLLILS